MIIRSQADAEKFLEVDGRCGIVGGGMFCSSTCQEHGAHVATREDGTIFARGTAPDTVSSFLKAA